MKLIPISLLSLLLILPLPTYAQTTSLACNLPSGKQWGTLKIDLKQKTIIDKNVLQKASADYLERWNEKYYREKGKEYKTQPFDSDKSAVIFKITKINDETIFGESHSLTYKSIEINRYTLQMKYPEMPSDDIFQCSKIEKAF